MSIVCDDVLYGRRESWLRVDATAPSVNALRNNLVG